MEAGCLTSLLVSAQWSAVAVGSGFHCSSLLPKRSLYRGDLRGTEGTTYPRIPLPDGQGGVQGPRDHCGLHALPEGPTELSKAVHPCEDGARPRKDTGGTQQREEVRGAGTGATEPRHELPHVPSPGSHVDGARFSQNACDSTHRALPAGTRT